jgi:hypothetical protein
MVRELITPDDFGDPTARSLAERLLASASGDAPPDVASMIGELVGSEGGRLLAELSAECRENQNGDRLCGDYVRTIRKRQLEEEVRRIDSAIRAAEMTDDEVRLDSLMEQRQELAARLMELSTDAESGSLNLRRRV